MATVDKQHPMAQNQVPLFKFDMWSSWLQKDIEKDRTVMDTINALVVVAAFIAGVQGSIIQFTMTLPQNRLGRSTNFFAFTGLMLDIIGTFSGVIHTLVLQGRIHRSTSLLNYVTQTKAGTEAQNAKTDLLGFGIGGNDTLLRRVAWLEGEMRRRFLSRSSKMIPMLHRLVPNPIAPTCFPMEELPRPDRTSSAPSPSALLVSPFELGHTPLISMGLGVIALAISIILFTAETTTLAREVWISCISVLFTVMAFALGPISYSLLKRRWKRMNKEEADVDY